MHRNLEGTWARVLVATTLVVTLAHAPVVSAEALWVSFHSAGAAPSSAHPVLSPAQVQLANPALGAPLRGLLSIPKGEGPFPAVILMHDCRGLRHFQREWVRKLANWGYVALLVDSFYSRYIGESCGQSSARSGIELGSARIADVYGAMEYLAGLKIVATDRIGLLSWDRENALSTVNQAGFPALSKYRFAAAVAITPSCIYSTGGQFNTPVLVLSAGRDDWVSVAACEHMVKASQLTTLPVAMKVYPQAWHGFDDPLLRSGIFLKSVYNPNRTPALGATLRYDRKAHEDSVNRIQNFLQQYLQPTPSSEFSLPGVLGTWAVDPYQIGPDIPLLGRSLFDQLFSRQTSDGPRYDVPFPLSRVLERIRSQLGDHPVAIGSGYDPGSEPGILMTLIPLGRSLQRFAAEPDFFASPRVVIAVVGEPRDIAPGQQPLRLNDRLFLGYQEQAKVLEVISYNEQASRFEFQIVDDYAAGLEPKVAYANRTVCRSCHQNGSPIFSKAAWAETNNNLLISDRLGEISKTFYGISYRSGTVGPAAIDNATDRANLFSVRQLLWRKLCGTESAAQRRCRAAALIAILQQRLSASTGFDREAVRYRKDYLLPVTENWKGLWPQGLLVPNPDIPNREPLLNTSPADIPAELDPLRTRPPLTVLKAEHRKDLELMITGLAENLPEADMVRLDRELFARGLSSTATPRYRLSAGCRILRRGSAWYSNQVQLDCLGASGDMKFQGEFNLHGAEIRDGVVRQIDFDANNYVSDLEIVPGRFHKQGRRWVADLELRNRGSHSHVRLKNGHALEKLRVAWPVNPESGSVLPPTNTFSGSVEALLMDDFSALIKAVETLRDATLTEPPGDLFKASRFDAIQIMQALMPALGMTASRWCCDKPRPLPLAVAHDAITTDAAFNRDLMRHSALNTFIRNCGRCHRTNMAQPPNYLAGDKSAVTRQIAHCAERIYVRLSMWDLPADGRPKSPMPPPHSLHSTGLSQQAWRASRDLASMKAYVSGILKAQRGESPSLEQLLSGGYDATRGCLDAGVAATAMERQ